SVLTENRTFRLAGSYATTGDLERALATGRLDVGVVVPYDFVRLRSRARPVTVQVLVNAVNANTAQLAQGYVEGAIAWLDQQPGAMGPPLARGDASADGEAPRTNARGGPPRVQIRTAFLYNPGLVSAWFTVTGVLGTLITLNGSLVAAATMIKEKERGTVEQLLMTPASALQVVTAKIVPLFALLMGMTGLALLVSRLVFRVPFRGSG